MILFSSPLVVELFKIFHVETLHMYVCLCVEMCIGAATFKNTY